MFPGLALVALLAASPQAATPPPEQTLAQLKAGNARFVEGHPAHGDQDAAVRKKLASGQHPDAVVLTCSDSRVSPELLFDQGLGHLFVVRVAGNVTETATMAAVEYGVEHLGTKVVLVMGHTSCGAVSAALTPKDQLHGEQSPSLTTVLDEVRDNIKVSGETLTAADLADARKEHAVRANVLGAARHLVQDSPLVKHAVEEGKAVVIPAVYDLASGKVEMFDRVKPAMAAVAPAKGKAAAAAHPPAGSH
jgi:carbonic anhydrase